ncbi:MAG: DNA polymerase III subunit beta [Betaproteobacteria bacterium]|jgi:DNA polymerase-3 subunit beta|nr:DNA polymerase III subunit beta [Betaproteobacteria bacterium]
MILIKAQRDALLKPLQTVTGIVERRHTLPILSNVLISKNQQTISFCSTDIEMQIRTSSEMAAGDEPLSTTVAARKLLDILRALPDQPEITVSYTNKKLSLAQGKAKFSLQTLPAEDFPTVVSADQYPASITLPQRTLKQLLHLVHFAMAQQDIRYYLNGLLLVIDQSSLKAVATDGHRLAFSAVTQGSKEVQINIDGERQEVIIPRKAIIECQRLLDDSDSPVTIDLASNQARFRFGQVELLSKLIEGKFPDYQRVIPAQHQKIVSIQREQFLGALQRAAILTTDKFKGVRLTLSIGSLKISSTNAEQEEASDDIEVDYSGESVDIGFNVQYLIDVLSNLRSNTVQITLQDSNASALITSESDPDFKYVVMPMRI